MTSTCESILADLPEWFGSSESNGEYVRDLANFPTFVAQHQGCIVGFMILREHYAESWEIHCLAVERTSHRQGIGRELVCHGEKWLRSRGVRILHVKTLAPSHPDPFYARTRDFYSALGFHRVFETTALWGPKNPCLVSVKLL